MAAYVMTINKDVSIEMMVNSGVYSTILPDPKKGKWRIPQEGTFADYLSMTPGDSIYFFSERKIGATFSLGNPYNIYSPFVNIFVKSSFRN